MKVFWIQHPEKVEEAKTMWADGFSASQIASAIGASRNTVIGKLHRLGIAGSGGIQRSPAKPRARAPKLVNAPAELPSVPADEPPVLVRDGHLITMIDLEPHDCRWGHGDPVSPNFHFCANPQANDSPYCAYHCAQAYVVARLKQGAPAKESDDAPADVGEAA